jgi:arginase
MHIEILGVPVDLGADRRGVDMGPSAIRYADLVSQLAALGHDVRDLGNVTQQPVGVLGAGSAKAKYEVQIMNAAEAVAKIVSEAVARGAIPLVLGGDHSISLGSVPGASGRATGLLWLDAHGDFNTPDSTPSGNVHGMVLAALTGTGPANLTLDQYRRPAMDPARVALVGIRDVDVAERQLLRASGVRYWTISEVDRRGIGTVMEEALAVCCPASSDLHVSLDMDVCDPTAAPGVGTPVEGGITYREGQLAMEIVASTGALSSMDVVEVNPILDSNNKTAKLAVGLIVSAFGKTII